jgi:hypothetical protein
MDDGGKTSSGLKLSTNSFTLEEVKILRFILNTKYKLEISIHSTGKMNQYNLYIGKISMPILFKLIKPYLHPSMYYKINI